jgi:phosphate transport system substrate-binding protein
MKIITRLLALLLALALIGCGGTTAVQNSSGPSESTSQNDGADPLPIAGIDAETYPYIDGSIACHPLLARIYEEICGISADEAETLVPFNLGGTLMVWTKMLGGTSYMSTAPDLLIAYEPPEYVKESRAEKLANFEIDPIGRDALVFLVTADNPVDNLTTQQLYDIYTGKITDWSEVGGGAGEIQAFQRDDYSSSQALFMKLLMHGDTPIEAPTELRGNAMGWPLRSLTAPQMRSATGCITASV